MAPSAPNNNNILIGKLIYQFWFRRGNQKPEFVIFPYNGGLGQAIDRCRTLATNTGLRFCGVYPCLIDLDQFEKEILNPDVNKTALEMPVDATV